MIAIPDHLRAAFAAASARFLPQWDPLWLPAQIYQESRFNPNAVSAAGAKGISQFMDATWQDMLVNCPDLPKTATPFEAVPAIHAAAFYMSKLRGLWKSDRSEEDRRRLAQASYNAGFGNVRRAQEYAGGARTYEHIIARLPDVTGPRNAHETRTYVERIERWHDELLASEGAVDASR